MNYSELTIKTIINDLEKCLDKNGNTYYKLCVQWINNSQIFYAFSYNLPANTLNTLAETPEKFINRSVLITYEKLPNKDNSGTFFKVKEIEVL